MAATANRSLNPLIRIRSREREFIALYGFSTFLIIVIGVLGLIDTSWLRLIVESWINIHVLFGLLLCSFVLVRCHWRVKQSRFLLPIEARELSRHLTRIVCLVLFAVIGVRQIIGILGSVLHGGAIDFNLFDERFRNGPDTEKFDPRDDFQQFLASGFFALGIIRIVTFRLWLRAIERAAFLSMATRVHAALLESGR